ncbi:unnamed protein product [Ceutorhynchus assimilis]|uniref:Double jelly roll-like domain-containing protein n=1 Tax=Ceutorhynchus assimilis TaxID=467358 RepID=A0A9N9MHU9_9CUCU|nr:unnamed protein product [Ceutorhynchus assimilis]
MFSKIHSYSDKETLSKHKKAFQRFKSSDSGLGEKIVALGVSGIMKTKSKLGMGMKKRGEGLKQKRKPEISFQSAVRKTKQKIAGKNSDSTRIIDKNSDILIAFRSWELIEYPELLKTNRHNWPVKTSTRVETPRHVIVAFQTEKRDSLNSNMSEFDDINLRNIKVFLNSERYPYNDLNLDISKNRFAVLYEMYSQFQTTYYGKSDEPLFDPVKFKDTAPIASERISTSRPRCYESRI